MLKRFCPVFVLAVATLLLAACDGGPGQSSARVTQVGMTYNVGGKGDGSFNDAAAICLAKAHQKLVADAPLSDA